MKLWSLRGIEGTKCWTWVRLKIDGLWRMALYLFYIYVLKVLINEGLHFDVSCGKIPKENLDVTCTRTWPPPLLVRLATCIECDTVLTTACMKIRSGWIDADF